MTAPVGIARFARTARAPLFRSVADHDIGHGLIGTALFYTRADRGQTPLRFPVHGNRLSTRRAGREVAVSDEMGGAALVGIDDGALPDCAASTGAARAWNGQGAAAALAAFFRKLALVPVRAATIARGHANFSSGKALPIRRRTSTRHPVADAHRLSRPSSATLNNLKLFSISDLAPSQRNLCRKSSFSISSGRGDAAVAGVDLDHLCGRGRDPGDPQQPGGEKNGKARFHATAPVFSSFYAAHRSTEPLPVSPPPECPG